MADMDTSAPAGGTSHTSTVNMPAAAPASNGDKSHAGHGIVGGLLLGGVGLGLIGGIAYAAVSSGKTTQLLVNQAAQGAKVDYIMSQTNLSAQALVQVPALITNSALMVEQFGQNQGFRDFEKRWHHHHDYDGGIRVGSPSTSQFDNQGGFVSGRR